MDYKKELRNRKKRASMMMKNRNTKNGYKDQKCRLQSKLKVHPRLDCWCYVFRGKVKL